MHWSNAEEKVVRRKFKGTQVEREKVVVLLLLLLSMLLLVVDADVGYKADKINAVLCWSDVCCCCLLIVDRQQQLK